MLQWDLNRYFRDSNGCGTWHGTDLTFPQYFRGYGTARYGSHWILFI
jgi:hypothetical protein